MNRKQAMKKATSSLRISVVLAMLLALLVPAGAAVAATDAYSTAVLADNPIHYYRLGEAAGPTAVDEGTSPSNGTYGASVALPTAGLVANSPDTAAGFDGATATDFVDTGVTSMGGGPFTVEAWINAATITGQHRVIAKDEIGIPGASLLWFNGSALRFQVRNSADTAWLFAETSALSAATTYHVAGVFDGTDAILYVDGAEVDRVAVGPTINTNTLPITIGADSDPINPRGHIFDGTIDEVAIYDYALADTRIQAHFDAASSTDVFVDLYAVTGTAALPGTSVPVWGYNTTNAAVSQPGGPTIYADEGATVSVTLHNQLGEPTGLIFGGQSMIPDLTGVADGGSAVYTFIASDPGTYMYEASPLNSGGGGAHQVAMGLYGALVVRPATAGQAYNAASTAFDDEAVLVLSEIDPALNTSASPATFDMREFAPRYFLINGEAYPDTDNILTAAGNNVLLRYVNAGTQFHSMAALGAHQTVIALDGNPLTYSRRYVSETFGPGQTADSIIAIPAGVAGAKLPIYDGSLLLHNSNAGGFGGMLTFLEISGAVGGPDTTGPVTSGVAYSAGFLTATVDDTTTGGADVAAAEYYVDSTSNAATPMAAADGTFNAVSEAVIDTAVIFAAGPHTVFVRGQDSLGNWGPFNSVLVDGGDTMGPETRSLTLNPNPTNGTLDVELLGTGDDSAAGGSLVIAAEYTIDGSCPLPNAQFPNGDCAMEVPGPAPIASVQDTIPAAIVDALTEGVHTIAVRSQDSVLNWGDPVTIDLVVDKTGPAATGVTVSPNPNNGHQPFNPAPEVPPAVRVSATLDDALSNVVAAEGFLDTAGADGTGFVFVASDGVFDSMSEVGYADIPLTTISQLSLGAHPIWVHGRDAAGNWGPLGMVELVITTDPTATIAAPANGATLGAPVAITGTATDDVAVTEVRVEIFDRDTVEWWNGTAWQAARTYVNASIAPGGASTGWTYVFNPPQPAATAPYWMTARAYDADGNRSTRPTRNFTIRDLAAPTIELDAPINGATVPLPATISGVATDDVGVAEVRVEIFDRDTTMWWDGAAWQGARTFAPADVTPLNGTAVAWSLEFDPPAAATAPYWLTARAYDAAGNRSTRPTANFRVGDVEGPVVEIEGPLNGATVAGPLVTIEGSAIDNVGVTEVRIEIFDRNQALTTPWWHGTGWTATRTQVAATVVTVGDANVSWSYDFDLGVLPPATLPYWVTARGYDAAGNRGARLTTNFTVN